MKINWNTIKPGTWFTADIESRKCMGKIQKEGKKIFFCQDVKEGTEAVNTLGFNYSWELDKEVKNLAFYKRKPRFTKPLSIDNKDVEFFPGYIKVGCTRISNEVVRRVAAGLRK